MAVERDSPGRRRLLKGAAALCGLGALPAAAQRAPRLPVGSLPVTCSLTLPIVAHASAKDPTGSFEFSKYSGWPEIKESLMTGRIQAAYMLAPLVMDLADRKIPVKVVALGHRSGAVIMVRTESAYRDFRSLRGKRVAIPSRFAVDMLFLRQMLKKEGMTEKDVQVVEMAPPDMPAALYAKAVEAYCTGEPFGAVAQRAGYARPLSMTRDHWPLYMCCVLTVRNELVKANRPLVQSLVNYVLGAGVWLDQGPANREKGIAIASRREYFNQDVNVLRFVMQNPTDRVTYGDLKMVPAEFEDMMQQSLAFGTLTRPVRYESYVDDSFVRAARAVPIQIA